MGSSDTHVKRIVIVCAGGHGAVVADILQRAREAGADAVPVGFVDDTPGIVGTAILGIDVLAPIASLKDIGHEAVIVALGDNRARRELTERLLATGERLVSAIHPRACIAPSASIGEGSMISAGAIVTPRAAIGRSVIVNTNASIDHDSVIGDFAHVSAGATVGARCHIGAEALIALGATVVSGMTVGARTVIGSGAAVVADIPADVVAFGIPARIRPDRTP
ncbi:MAG TPA: acetyltransferase [Thermoanaerobaculia bacterium]|jgi:sugar O-acyltransferase (sialic acid O-acetyltransferase NeuD family)|nr:acetyltransferase [Thermoanaerobaculia bacterium]